MATMKTLTKNQFEGFARSAGYSARYDGNTNTFYLFPNNARNEEPPNKKLLLAVLGEYSFKFSYEFNKPIF